MREERQAYLRTLCAQLSVLEVGRIEIEAGDPRAVPAVQRVIRSIADTARRAGFPEIVRAAVAASESAPGSASLETLLVALRELVNGRDFGETHILVIEDDPVTSRFVDRLLSMPKRHVHLCCTLAEAELALATYDVTLVILDIGLPDGDGRSLLARLRAQSFHATLPIIVVSGLTGPQSRTECLALGADDYIPKPITPVELSALVTRLVARR